MESGFGFHLVRITGRKALAPPDFAALRGQVLAVVEVKRRTTLTAALEAVTPDQRERLRRAGLAIAASRPALGRATVRLDLIALAPGRLPRHIPDAWKGGAREG